MNACARRNIEFKTQLADLTVARGIARDIATATLGVELQIDTYFAVTSGRLKLREIEGHGARLIAYRRPDRKAARRSDYHLVDIADPAGLKAALAAVPGIRQVVHKRREIFLWHNVRIHLDEVAALGNFLEFEAVLDWADSDAMGEAQLAELAERFGFSLDAGLAPSYADLLDAQSP